MSRADVSEERRPQIIEAAIQVFIRKGYRKTTMPDIARQAGLSVGGVYWYFKSKAEIVQAILSQLFQSDLQSLTILADEAAPAADRLRTFAHRYLETYHQLAWLDPIGIHFYAEAPHDADVCGFIQQYLAHYRKALVTLIEQGIARSEFRPVNPQDAANALIALEEGLSLIMQADPQQVHWESSFMLAIDLFLAGLKPTSSHSSIMENKDFE